MANWTQQIINKAKGLKEKSSLLSGGNWTEDILNRYSPKYITDPYKKVTGGIDFKKLETLNKKKNQAMQAINSMPDEFQRPETFISQYKKSNSIISNTKIRENWVRNELAKQKGSYVLTKPIFDRMPYYELRREFPEVEQLEQRYKNERLSPMDKAEDVALDRIRLSQKKFTTTDIYDPKTDTWRAKNISREYIDPNKQLYDDFETTTKLFVHGIPAGLVGYETEEYKKALESGDFMSKLAASSGNLVGFIGGLYGAGLITKGLGLTGKIVTGLTKIGISERKARIAATLIKSGVDFTLLGQVHSTVRGDSWKEHFKSAGVDFVSGIGLTLGGMAVSKLPKFMQPIVEGSIWAGIAKAQGADNQTALIQGILFGGMRGFGLMKPSLEGVNEMTADKFLTEAERFLKVKRTDTKGIIEAFEKKTKNLKQGTLEYQKAEASAVALLYPRQVFGMVKNVGSFQESRPVGLFGKGKFKEGERPGIEKTVPLPEEYFEKPKTGTEKTTINYIKNNYQQAKVNYIKRIQKEFGTTNIVSADDAKYIIPGYEGKLAPEYHKASSGFAKKYFNDLLQTQKGVADNTVTFTSGGTGVGKTTALRSVTNLKDKAIIFDTNLTGEGGLNKIRQAIRGGYDVDIIYIQRDPVEAFVNGVLPRVRSRDRIITIDEHVKRHKEAFENLEIIKKEFGDKVNIEYIDNTGGKGKAKVVTLDKLPKFIYNEVELKKTLSEKLQKVIRPDAKETGTGITSEEASAIYGRKIGGEFKPQRDGGKIIGGEKKLTTEELYKRDMTPEKASKKLQRSFDKLKELGTKEIPIEKFNPLEAKEINPIQRTLAEAQAVKFEVKSRLEGMVEAFKRSLNIKELEDIKTGNALTERIDMGKPLPENLKKLETLIPLLTEQQKFLSSQLKSKKIAEALWDEETYVRRILIQKDGSKPTATQLAALESASDKIKGDLMRVASGSTQYGLSTKSKFYQKRKFETIDQADTYLDKFGLKMNRNFFKSLVEQWSQASDILYNYTFTKSLRDQAKLGVKGVKEIYDPAEFKLAVEEEGLKMRSIIDSLLGKSKQLKNISNDQYKELKEHVKEEYSRMKNRSKKTLEKEDYKEAIEDLDMSFGAFKESLLRNLKEGKIKITDEIKTNTENVRKVFGDRINDFKINIRNKWAEAQDAGYGKLPDVVLANQLRGVVLTKDLSKSLKHVLAQKPTLTSVEDAIVTLKTAQLTMDVFKIKDLIEASFGTGFIQSPVSMYRFRDTAEYIATAKKHIRGGLSVDVPIDVNVKLLERMGELKEVKETESLFLKYLHKGAETKIGKVVVYPFEKALILENFQWNIELPAYKVKTADLLYEAMQKKYPNISKEDLLFRVDDFVNSAFQGQNWEQIMAKHPNLTHGTPRLLRALFLGPDKITSTFRLATTSAKIGNKALGARMLGKYVFRTFAMGTLITQILNYALNRHSTLENTRGNEFSVEVPGLEDEKGNPFSFQIYGSAFEIIKFLNKPLPTLRNKLTGMLSSLLEIIKPSYGKVQPSRVMESIEPLPINLQTMLSYAYGQMFDNGEPQYGRPETFIGALANLGAEFSGFPTTYRTGEGEMSLVDVLRGDFIFKEYILGEKPKSEKAGTLKMPELKGGKKKEKAKGKIDFSKIKF